MKTNSMVAFLARRAGTSLLLLSLTLSFAGATAGSAASVSELMEKGIYAEETKGDLDEAVALYKQIVAEGAAGQAVAAQAQYHLGVCYYKKKNFAEASAAFEKLIQDFPNQKEFVDRAREYLAGAIALLPAPWADSEELRLDLKLASGFKMGMTTYRVEAGETNGQKIWRFSSRLWAAGAEQMSRVEVAADTLKPIHSRWKHSLLGDADTTYADGKAEIRFAGKPELKTVDLEGAVFDNEEVGMGMRRLPLATNGSVTLRILPSLGGGRIMPIDFTVTGVETVRVPAGTFECYKVELSLVKQSFYLSTDEHRYLVKFEANGVTAELVSITHPQPGQPARYDDAERHFSLTAPAGWDFCRVQHDASDTKGTVVILDPEVTASATLQTLDLTGLKPETAASLRDWANSQMSEYGRAFKDFQVRADSWKEIQVGDKAGWCATADFGDKSGRKAAYAAFSFVSGKAVAFYLNAPAKQFDTLQPQFAGIVGSYKPN